MASAQIRPGIGAHDNARRMPAVLAHGSSTPSR
jgi:hypothetical protein